jgi:hypothetical protein
VAVGEVVCGKQAGLFERIFQLADGFARHGERGSTEEVAARVVTGRAGP